MATKPLISIEIDVTVRRSYLLDQDAAKDIEGYAQFLTELARRPSEAKAGEAKKKGKSAPQVTVTPGQVISKLTARLAKDPLFQEWKRARQTGA